MFYVTPLDSSCLIILGYSWLSLHNLLIDWVTGSIDFQTTPYRMPSTPPTSPPLPDPIPTVEPHPPTLPEPSADNPVPNISLINAVAFCRACKLEGSTQFSIYLCPSRVDLCSGKLSSKGPDLSGVPSDYHEFADVFDKGKASQLPLHHLYNLKIDLEEGSTPPLGTIYPLSPVELEALRKFLDENITTRLLRSSSSPHGALVLFVKKKDGSLCLCVDFRGLNQITKKDQYLLPLISNLLESPSRAKIYMKIDLRSTYHPIQIASGDEWKTAFRTHYGSYEWLVMPEGLTNAPAVFQQFVNSVFADMLDICVIIYLDDILIYSQDLASHKNHVREVLRCLCKHQLYAKPEKCEFHSMSMEYLGYLLSPDGLTMSNEKVQAIIDWLEPQKVKDIQSFLGFANFHHRFIYNYSDIVVLLTRLTRKDAPWNFLDECRKSFEMLKRAFTTAPILMHWMPNVPLIVEMDALDYAIAGILSIICLDSEIRPVAFYSRTLTPLELNYDTHDKELLAIHEAFWTWRHYLEGSSKPVDVVTDHKNLEYFATTKLLSHHQARWSEFLHQFNMIICFRPRKLGAKPDFLTRHWDVYPKERDKDYTQVNPHNFHPIFTSEQLASSLQASTLAFPVLHAAVLMDVEQLHKDILSTLPNDPIGSARMSDPPDDRWTVDDSGFLRCDNRIYVPEYNDLRLRVLQNTHDHPLSGHFGLNRTLELI